MHCRAKNYTRASIIVISKHARENVNVAVEPNVGKNFHFAEFWKQGELQNVGEGKNGHDRIEAMTGMITSTAVVVHYAKQQAKYTAVLYAWLNEYIKANKGKIHDRFIVINSSGYSKIASSESDASDVNIVLEKMWNTVPDFPILSSIKWFASRIEQNETVLKRDIG